MKRALWILLCVGIAILTLLCIVRGTHDWLQTHSGSEEE